MKHWVDRSRPEFIKYKLMEIFTLVCSGWVWLGLRCFDFIERHSGYDFLVAQIIINCFTIIFEAHAMCHFIARIKMCVRIFISINLRSFIIIQYYNHFKYCVIAIAMVILGRLLAHCIISMIWPQVWRFYGQIWGWRLHGKRKMNEINAIAHDCFWILIKATDIYVYFAPTQKAKFVNFNINHVSKQFSGGEYLRNGFFSVIHFDIANSSCSFTSGKVYFNDCFRSFSSVWNDEM